MVIYTHLLAPNHDVDPRYFPSSAFWWFEAGQGAVLLFFVLSGYVIGLTNQAGFSPWECRRYLLRRTVRLVPLCWLAIGLSVLVLPGDSGRTILANLLFLQNELPYGSLSLPLLDANTNLWSLNYEALYYLLFLAVWALPPAAGVRLALAACLGMILLGVLFPGFPGLVTNYATGWLFWLVGLWLSRAPQSAGGVRWPWPALMLFALATWKIKPLFQLAKRFDLLPPATGWVNYSFIDLIPVCLALVMIAAQRQPRRARLWVHLAALVPVTFFLWRVLRGRAFGDEHALYDAVVLAAAGLWWWRPSIGFLSWAAPLGTISYGLYIFQRPAQWLVAHGGWLPDGNLATFVLRLLVILALTFALAWFAERKLQPVIRRAILGRPAPRTPPPQANPA
jgi:peptidoglycan/LPS O-acetylase OafA/YrhL